MSRSRRQFRGSGLGKSDDQVADALTTCINAVRSLAVPSRRRVMRGSRGRRSPPILNVSAVS